MKVSEALRKILEVSGTSTLHYHLATEAYSIACVHEQEIERLREALKRTTVRLEALLLRGDFDERDESVTRRLVALNRAALRPATSPESEQS